MTIRRRMGRQAGQAQVRAYRVRRSGGGKANDVMIALIAIPVVGIALVFMVHGSQQSPAIVASTPPDAGNQIVPAPRRPGEEKRSQHHAAAARPYERVKMPGPATAAADTEPDPTPDELSRSWATAAKASLEGTLRVFDRALKQDNFAHAKRLLAQLERDGCDAAVLVKARADYEAAVKALSPERAALLEKAKLLEQQAPLEKSPLPGKAGPQPSKVEPAAVAVTPPAPELRRIEPDEPPESGPRNNDPVPGRITQDCNTKDPETRRRAARQLGATGSDAATYLLAKGLDDPDGELAAICREGLVSIGGARAAEHLVKLYRDGSQEKQRRALGVLVDMAKKSYSEGFTVSPYIGRYALSNDEAISQESITALTSLGKPGGPGLLVAIESVQPEKQCAVMSALAAVRYYKAAHRMGDFLIQGDGFVLEKLRNTAMTNLIAMGPHTIPYLIPHLQTRCRQWTAVTLRRMTGAKLGYNDAKEWRDWYETNKSSADPVSAPVTTPSAPGK